MAVEDRIGTLEALTGELATELRGMQDRLAALEAARRTAASVAPPVGARPARAAQAPAAAPEHPFGAPATPERPFGATPAAPATPERPFSATPAAPGTSERPSGAPATPESPIAAAPAAPAVPPGHSHPSTPPVPARRAAPRDWAAVEDAFGGRALAWIGGLALLVGIVLLLALAVRNGWLGEEARTALAAAVSAALVGAGIRLRDRRTDAAVAAVAAGTAGLFATVAVATQHYELLPTAAGLLGAAATAAVATTLAIRWAAPGIGALGLGGALLAPVLSGAGVEGAGLLFLLIASIACVAVVLAQRWTWLAGLAFAFATPQWVVWTGDEPASAVLAVAATFGLVNALAAVGHDLLRPPGRLQAGAAVLLALNAAVVTGAGAWGAELDEPAAWVAALAAAHLAAAGALGATRRASRELVVVLAALGIALADLAFASVAGAGTLVFGWAALAAGFAWLLRETSRPGGPLAPAGVGAHGVDATFARLGLGAHLLLALTIALDVRERGGDAAGPALAVALACLVAARLTAAERDPWRPALDSAAAALIALVLADALEGAALTAALAAQAALMAAAARRLGGSREHAPDVTTTAGALGVLAVAAVQALGTAAPPAGLIDGVDGVGAAAVALGALAAAALAAARPLGRRALRDVGIREGGVVAGLRAAAIVALVHLGSLAVVTASPADAAQLSLSAFWALAGVALLLAGLRLDERGMRAAGLALLAVTAGKVFLYDLASLESVYRVASFIALGVLLLGAAHAWQRLRPREGR